MIVVDTSAIVAVLFEEDDSQVLHEILLGERCVMSAATRVEAGIVIEARAGAEGTLLLEELLQRVGVVVLPVDEELASEAMTAWRRFGRGRHPAGLNFGDLFSYALARRLGQPLLHTGKDFSKTDVTRRRTPAAE